MNAQDLGSARDDELVIALGPGQLAAVLAILVVVFVLIRARRAR